MIWDSVPWKRDLLRDAELLARWSTKRHAAWVRQDFIIEKKVFLAAYAIRKLFEAEKLRTALKQVNLKCVSYPRKVTTLTPLNSHQVDRHYDFGEPTEVLINIRTLVDQIIHSHVFMLTADKLEHIDGFLVASDRGKELRLLAISLHVFCDFM